MNTEPTRPDPDQAGRSSKSMPRSCRWTVWQHVEVACRCITRVVSGRLISVHPCNMCACLRDKALLASKHLQEQGFSTIKLRHLGVTACIVHCYSIVERFSFDILFAFAIFGFGLTWKKFEAEQGAIFFAINHFRSILQSSSNPT